MTSMPSGFKGQFNHSIDAKGRLIIPTKLRGGLGESFVLTKGLDGCLYGYPNDEWQNFEENLRKISNSNKNGRKLKEYFVAGAIDCEFDTQGRIIIPSYLRDAANLKKDVAIIGNIEKIEIWDVDTWEARKTSIEEDMDSIIDEMSDLGVIF